MAQGTSGTSGASNMSSNSFSVAAGYPQSLNRSNTSVSVSNGSPSSSFSPIIKPHGVNRLSSADELIIFEFTNPYLDLEQKNACA